MQIFSENKIIQEFMQFHKLGSSNVSKQSNIFNMKMAWKLLTSISFVKCVGNMNILYYTETHLFHSAKTMPYQEPVWLFSHHNNLVQRRTHCNTHISLILLLLVTRIQYAFLASSIRSECAPQLCNFLHSLHFKFTYEEIHCMSFILTS